MKQTRYLVKEGQSTVLVGQVADFFDGSDTAAHRVDALEGNDLGSFLRVLLQLGFQILQIVVLENDTFGAGVTHALNHGGVVHSIGEVDAAREFSTES